MSTNAVEGRSEASIVSIRQNVSDHRAVARELQEARKEIHSQQHEIARLKHLVSKQANDLAFQEGEKRKLQIAIDALVKELSATKASARETAGLNDQLRRDIVATAPRASTAAFGGRSPLRAVGGDYFLLNNVSTATDNTRNTYSHPSPTTRKGASPARPTSTGAFNSGLTNNDATPYITGSSSNNTVGGGEYSHALRQHLEDVQRQRQSERRSNNDNTAFSRSPPHRLSPNACTTTMMMGPESMGVAQGTSPLTPSRPRLSLNGTDGPSPSPTSSRRPLPRGAYSPAYNITNTNEGTSQPRAEQDEENERVGNAEEEEKGEESNHSYPTVVAQHTEDHHQLQQSSNGAVVYENDHNGGHRGASAGRASSYHTRRSTGTAEGHGGGGDVSIPLALYLRKCLERDVTAHPLVVKSFYRNDGSLVAGDAEQPISYRQLEPLVETLDERRFASGVSTSSSHSFSSPTAAGWGPSITRLEVVTYCSAGTTHPSSNTLNHAHTSYDSDDSGEEARGAVSELILLCAPTLTSLLVSDIDDKCAGPIAGAIAVAFSLQSLELPRLRVGDEGMRLLMKLVANRDVAAYAAAASYSQTNQHQEDSLADSKAKGMAAREARGGAIGGDNSSRDTFKGYTASEITLGAASPSASAAGVTTSTGSLVSTPQSQQRLSKKASVVGSPITLNFLDLSETRLCDSDTFFLIKGTFLNGISFRNCAGLLDKYLGEVILSSPNLHTLDLTNCTSLTQDAVLYLLQAKNLQRLVLSNCVSIHNLRLGDSVVELSTDLRGVTSLTAPGLEKFVTPLTSFTCVDFECPMLKEISMVNTTLSARELGLLAQCSNLTSAEFINCRVVPTNAAGGAASAAAIGGGGGLQNFLNRTRKLRRLSLAGCKGVSDADMESIGRAIEELDLTNCFYLTDKALQKIALTCRYLKRLTLKNCSGISDSGLFYLSQCPELEYVNLLGMRKVTSQGIRRMCEQFTVDIASAPYANNNNNNYPNVNRRRPGSSSSQHIAVEGQQQQQNAATPSVSEEEAQPAAIAATSAEEEVLEESNTGGSITAVDRGDVAAAAFVGHNIVAPPDAVSYSITSSNNQPRASIHPQVLLTGCPLRHIVHESFVSSVIRVDRNGD